MIKEVGWGVAKLEACSPSIRKTLSSIPSATKSRLVVPVISALRRQIWGWSSRGEDREFKVILGYLRPCLKNEKKKRYRRIKLFEDTVMKGSILSLAI